MIHLGQLSGRVNIPEDITDKHDADDFPLVEIDDDGNITELIKEGNPNVPSIKPYLPWYSDEKEGYIPRQRVVEFVERIKDSEAQAASAEVIQKALLES